MKTTDRLEPRRLHAAASRHRFALISWILTSAGVGLAIAGLATQVNLASQRVRETDPCASARKLSNADERNCYTSKQSDANAKADALVKKIAQRLREDTGDIADEPVAKNLLHKAASELIESQRNWKNFRDQHCRAVELSWTTGSGAGTAYEACMLDLAEERIRDLRDDFGPWTEGEGSKTSK